MKNRPEANGQPSSAPPDQDLVARLYEQIARLHASVQALRRTSEELEADRQRLLEENRALQRQVTVSTLLDEIDVSTELDEQDVLGDAVPPSAQRFYQQLPDRFSFSLFFQIAEDEHVETSTARRCLVHYLTEGALVQSGAYLEKTDPPPAQNG
jgi:regulator of replication initiation timing